MMDDRHGMDDMASHKMSSLRDLIGEMKKLHGQNAMGKPKGLAVEVHEAHVEPLSHGDVENLEELTHQDLDGDNEEGESPEHQEAVLGHSDMDDEDMDHEEDEQEPEMDIPHGLLQLLAEKLAK